MKTQIFGTTKNNEEVRLYTLTAGNSEAVMTDYGAALVAWRFKCTDVVLGYDDLAEYENRGGSFGATVGRCANRIAGAKFTIGGEEYNLYKNDGENTRHSGPPQYNKRLWKAEAGADGNSVTFTLFSPDGDQNFPGNLTLSVTYTLTDEDELILDYTGTCDKDTVLNPTNHSYFNLSGHNAGSIGDHSLRIGCETFTPARSDAIPDGRILPVKGTPFDFTEFRTIGERINDDDEQLKIGKGYDHNFCIDLKPHPVRKAAEARSPVTGISLEVFTDLPGLQFYSGNGIAENVPGKDGAVYGPRYGFCLETQFYPNAVNEEAFASPVLKAGDTFRSRTVYRLR